MRTGVSLTLLALAATDSAQLDLGGGKSAVGTMIDHPSIGAIAATPTQSVRSQTLRSGLIDLIYATGQPSKLSEAETLRQRSDYQLSTLVPEQADR